MRLLAIGSSYIPSTVPSTVLRTPRYSIFSLNSKMNVSAIAGIAGRLQGLFRGKIAVITDERVRILTELVDGMLLIKMSAWEDMYISEIGKVRQ